MDQLFPLVDAAGICQFKAKMVTFSLFTGQDSEAEKTELWVEPVQHSARESRPVVDVIGENDCQQEALYSI